MGKLRHLVPAGDRREAAVRVVVKKVYYCDFCKKHSLRPLTRHEGRCTGNPDRECRWAGFGEQPHLKAGELRPHVEWCKQFREMDEDTLEAVRKRVKGCPACMIAVLRQARPDDVEAFEWWRHFDLDREKERFDEEWQYKDEYAAEDEYAARYG